MKMPLSNSNQINIFLCGDVMTGRGIDQILSHPCGHNIYESYLHDARDYVKLAEDVSGEIPRKVSSDYIWGDALSEWRKRKPTIKIINLETAITQYETSREDKGINYRMHPNNVDVLNAANIDIFALANNHLFDWGYDGFKETLDTLTSANIRFAGAGFEQKQAMAPAIFNISTEHRILVFSMAMASSGVPAYWAAKPNHPGIYFISDLTEKSIQAIKQNIKLYKKPGDLIVLSLHWGSNWGYDVPISHQTFAHDLINQADVDLIHGHSSHHPRPIEIYKGKPILYGCGDFINDYEGIGGHESYRGDLVLMYFVEFDLNAKKMIKLEMVPMQIKKFKLHYALSSDIQWLWQILSTISTPFGTQLKKDTNNLIITNVF